MNRTGTSKTLVGWSIALAVGAFACGGRSGSDQFKGGDANRSGEPGAPAATTPGTAGTSGSAAAAANDKDNAPITLTGCLQKGDGRSDYILTQANSARTTVGTGGTTAPAGSASDVVGQEQMRAAEHSYKLSGDRDSLEPLVGKEVRVSGTVAKTSDLNAHDRDGKLKDRDRTKIDEGDLAKIDVASVDSVSNNCGGKSVRARPRRK